MRIKIGTKLIAAFVLILTLMVALAFYLMNESHQSLEDSVGKNSVFLAEEMLKRIDKGIYLKIEELESHCGHLVLHKFISESNRAFEKLANIDEYINQKDREWVSAPKDEITPFMQELITRDLSNHLRGDLVEFHHKKYGYKTIVEIFVTNRYGANVAQSGKTSDYRQDDEEWWQIAREKGHYISDVEYDESTGESAISLGIRIDDEEGNFIGVMKAVVAVKSIIRSAEIAVKRYETTRIKLITKDGRLIYKTTAFKFLEDVSGKPFFKQIKGEKGTFIGKVGEKERLYSFARSKGYRDFGGLGWILVVGHDVQEILKPVYKLRNRMTAASLILITIGIIIAFFMSRSITKPIAELSKGVEIIGKGDLEHRVDVKTKDEIGVLANTFNNMMADLKNVTASRDELNKEIDERKRAEEALEHLNSVLRAIRNVNQLITKEKDRDSLLQGACDNLVETRGYFSAWIALMDNSGKLLTTAESGLKEAFLPLVELMKRGELPVCGSRALKGSEVVAIEDPSATCTACPLALDYTGRGSMTVRLEYSGKVYGTFSVSVPRDFVANEEEQTLFGEVADDIAFALHNMELEEERKRAKEELEKHRESLEELVKERTVELQKTINLMAGREVRMAELKETIKKLRAQVESAGMTPVADDPLKEI